MPSFGMSQSGFMVAALLAGFIIWLAAAGKLKTYWALMTGAASSAHARAPAGGSGAGSPASGGQGAASQSGYLVPPLPEIGFPGLLSPFGPQ